MLVRQQKFKNTSYNFYKPLIPVTVSFQYSEFTDLCGGTLSPRPDFHLSAFYSIVRKFKIIIA